MDGTTIQVSTSPMTLPEPTAVHTRTRYRVRLQAEPWSSPFRVEDTDQFLTLIVMQDMPNQETVVVQAAHQNRGTWGPWSEEVTASTGDQTPVPDAPDVFQVELMEDTLRVGITTMSHPDGVTTFEDFDSDEPLPYPIAGQIQIQNSGGAWDEASLVWDTELVSQLVADMETEVGDLPAGTNFQARGRWQDGYHGTVGPWSPTLSLSTLATPAVRPDAPVLTMVVCDEIENGGVDLSVSDFVPHENGGQELARRHFRLRTPSTATRFRAPPEDVTIFRWDGLPWGTYTFDVRDEDSEGNLSLWSNSVECTMEPLPPLPVFTAPISGTVISTDTILRWLPQVEAHHPDLPWEYRIRRRPLDGGAWTVLTEGGAEEELLLSIDGLPNGSYLFDLVSCYPSGGPCGDEAFLFLRIDRSGVASVSIDFTRLEEIPEGWMLQLDDRDIEVLLPSSCPWEQDADPTFLNHGLLMRNIRPGVDRVSALVFPEFGEPRACTITSVFAILQPEVWIGWRFAHSPWLSGGNAFYAQGLQADADRAGVAVTAHAGFQPWYIYPQACLDGPSKTPPCETCRKLWCGACAFGAAWVGNHNTGHPNSPLAYARGQGRGGSALWGFMPGANFLDWVGGSSLPTAGGDVKEYGLHLSLDALSCDPFCPPQMYWYQARTQVVPVGDGDLRVIHKVVGPGLDPDEPQMDMILEDGDARLPCGPIGIALRSLWGVAGMGSILFRSFAAELPETFQVSGPAYGSAQVESDP